MKKRWMGFAALIAALVVIGLSTAGQEVGAQEPNQVGLVVQHGDGGVITRCVMFSEAEISGYEVLVRSGLEVVANFDSGMGATLCKIDGEGCPADSCWCQCQGSPCVYWAYHHLMNGQWVYSNLGASDYYVGHGSVEGWAWGEGNPQGSGAQPPVIPFEQICVPPATNTPVPTTTPAATATPIPPTATPQVPTATPTPLPAPDAWFRLDQNPVAAGACTRVRWDAFHAREVYLDGVQVAFAGEWEVCPESPQTYRLRVVGAEAEVTLELVLGVISETPSQPAPPAASSPAPTWSSPTAPALVAPTMAVSASVSPSPLPSRPPLPSVELIPTPSPAPVVAPAEVVVIAAATLTKTGPSPTPAVIAQANAGLTTAESEHAAEEAPAAGGMPLSYLVFGVMAGALVGWLVLAARRQG